MSNYSETYLFSCMVYNIRRCSTISYISCASLTSHSCFSRRIKTLFLELIGHTTKEVLILLI